MTPQETATRSLHVATWNMDHWKQTVESRREAWSFLRDGLGADVALLQECVVPHDVPASSHIYREIGGSRAWGSAVVSLSNGLEVTEVGPVRTRYGAHRFHLLGTYPGSIMVGRVTVPEVGEVTCVSVYGLIDVYAQTTMFRIVADLIPLFDSPAGERVVLGGDFNVSTAASPDTPALQRYKAVLTAVESLGLLNVAETAAERPSFENCPCGDAECHHLHTFGDTPGGQLDWLFATPALARRCRRVRVERERTRALSDHAPVVAEFDIPLGAPTREWDPQSFLKEVAVRNGPVAGRVAEELVAWAERKHQSLQRQGHTYASLDRLPISTGPDPELWVQLDLRYPDDLGWTFSISVRGEIILQFQYMRLAPFESEEGRSSLWVEINELVGVDLERRLSGRPSFPLEALDRGDNLQRFIDIFDRAIDDILRQRSE